MVLLRDELYNIKSKSSVTWKNNTLKNIPISGVTKVLPQLLSIKVSYCQKVSILKILVVVTQPFYMTPANLIQNNLMEQRKQTKNWKNLNILEILEN